MSPRFAPRLGFTRYIALSQILTARLHTFPTTDSILITIKLYQGLTLKVGTRSQACARFPTRLLPRITPEHTTGVLIPVPGAALQVGRQQDGVIVETV